MDNAAIRQKRRDVAEAFFYAHIDGANWDNEAIDAIAELISYGGNLDDIAEKMALTIEDGGALDSNLD